MRHASPPEAPTEAINRIDEAATARLAPVSPVAACPMCHHQLAVRWLLRIGLVLAVITYAEWGYALARIGLLYWHFGWLN